MDYGLASAEIRDFLNKLSLNYSQPIKVYLLGGSALCFLGSPRRTVDIDCVVEFVSKEFESAVEAVANELKLEVEVIRINEFIPLPSDTEKRHHKLEKFGNIEVFIFDPYSIALSKIARGFETDIQDVLFLLQQGIIEIGILAKFVEDAMPVVWDFDIDPEDLRSHLGIVKNLYA